MSGLLFVMAGGGTGGHVIPAIAVAREDCRKRGMRRSSSGRSAAWKRGWCLGRVFGWN